MSDPGKPMNDPADDPRNERVPAAAVPLGKPPMALEPLTVRGKGRKRRGIVGRIVAFFAKLVVGFVLLSVAMTVLYRFVPPPITWTMIGDIVAGHGVTKDWAPLSEIDVVYAGAEDAALFRSNDGAMTWQELPGLRAQRHR